MKSLAAISFVRGRCQSCKGNRKVFGGPCFSCAEPRPREQTTRPCAIVLTATPRSNGRQLRVRCECMSGVPARRPVDIRTPYDHLGDVDSVKEARALWRSHAS